MQAAARTLVDLQCYCLPSMHTHDHPTQHNMQTFAVLHLQCVLTSTALPEKGSLSTVMCLQEACI